MQVAYFLPPEVVLNPPTVSGELRSASSAEMSLILGWIEAFYAETLDAVFSPPDAPAKNAADIVTELFVWYDGEPVAMGLLSGVGEMCRLNLVYTAPEFRGRGYGRAVVCALAAKAREAAKIPMLYTSTDNAAANALYKKLGFREL